MQELVASVRADDLEAALDVLLPAYPEGVHVLGDGGTRALHVLLADGRADPPDLGGLLTEPVRVVETPDDWRLRRKARYRPRVYGGRVVVRPSWADPVPDAALLDVVLAEETAAFGTGAHPTTQACLELLCQLPPEASLADLGCGSGVLAITAAKLGWGSVTAVDVDERSVQAARSNAATNGVQMTVVRLDLTRVPPPEARVAVANVPAFVHQRLAANLRSRTVIATGIEGGDRDLAVASYVDAGYTIVTVEELVGWVLVVAERTR